MSRYDVIVIGAGNGGMSAAAYLANAGKKVLLLEKHNLPGGCATSYSRGCFEFEATLHELCQMAPGENGGAVRKLLDGYGLDVDWVSVDETFCTIVPGHYNVQMPVGVDAFIDAMEKEVPGSRESVTTVMELSRMICDGVDWLAERNNEPEGAEKVKMLFKWYDLMRLVPISTDDMLRKIGMPDKARQIFESFWTYVSANSKNMSFAVYATMTYIYIVQKPWIARNRSHEIGLAFDKRLRELGSDVWYNTEVTKIDVKDGAVKGVELKGGRYIECERVISNLMPHVVFTRMMDEKEVPEREKKLMNARTIAQSAFIVNLGLDASAEELGIEGYDTFIRMNPENYIQYEGCGSIETHKDFTATALSNAIPDAAPAGKCILQFSKFYTKDPFADVTEEEYFRVKDAIANECIESYEKITGVDLRGHIEEIVVASPVTWARYLGTPRGDVYGYEPHTWDGMFPRVQSGHYLDHTIKGLRFVGGHGTQMDGYSQAYMSGAEQARYTLLDMEEGI